MNQPESSDGDLWKLFGPWLIPIFLLSCPISIPAYFLWASHRAGIGTWSSLHTYAVKTCLIYVLIRTVLDALTVLTDRVSGAKSKSVESDDCEEIGKTRFTWVQYFVLVWFHAGEVVVGLVAFVFVIQGLFAFGNELDPLDIARQVFPTAKYKTCQQPTATGNTRIHRAAPQSLRTTIQKWP